MPYAFYNLVHVIGLILLFAAIGGVAFGRKEGGKPPIVVTITHGVGLLVMLVAGFGMLAKLGGSALDWWVLIKIGVWIVLGAMPVLIRKGVFSGFVGWFLSVLLASGAAYVAIYHNQLAAG